MFTDRKAQFAMLADVSNFIQQHSATGLNRDQRRFLVDGIIVFVLSCFSNQTLSTDLPNFPKSIRFNESGQQCV
jgi:hypothetical protein